MMRSVSARVWAVVLALAAASTCAAARADSSDLAGQQSEAEQEQADLRARINALQKDIDSREAARKDAADALRDSETAISRINLQLRDLGVSQRRAESSLANIEKQIAAQQGVLAQRREGLAKQLRAQYYSSLSPWSALLSGDDPQQLGRNLSYLDYVSQARVRALAALRVELNRMARLQTAAATRRAEIVRVVNETSAQKSKLVAEQKSRTGVLSRIEGQLAAQRAEAGRLDRDDQRLSLLINGLQTAIERQAAEVAARRAEAARKAEEARQAEAARQAQAARQAAADQAAALASKQQAAANDAAQARKQAELAESARIPDMSAQANPDGASLRPRLTEPTTPSLKPPTLSQLDKAAGWVPMEQAYTPDATPAGNPANPASKPTVVAQTQQIQAVPLQTQNQAQTQTQAQIQAQAQASFQAQAAQTQAQAQAASLQTQAASQDDSYGDDAAPQRRPHVTGTGLKRGLPLPVAGGIPQGRFGVGRPDGGVWRGIVLRAPEGTPVKAVADGVVVYADWLRGFGNLIIIDHGRQYVSVYGYNQSVLKHVGDPVSAGDTIATVGATGGQVESGLYFEIRYRGRPVDPAQWLAL